MEISYNSDFMGFFGGGDYNTDKVQHISHYALLHRDWLRIANIGTIKKIGLYNQASLEEIKRM